MKEILNNYNSLNSEEISFNLLGNNLSVNSFQDDFMKIKETAKKSFESISETKFIVELSKKIKDQVMYFQNNQIKDLKHIENLKKKI